MMPVGEGVRLSNGAPRQVAAPDPPPAPPIFSAPPIFAAPTAGEAPEARYKEAAPEARFEEAAPGHDETIEAPIERTAAEPPPPPASTRVTYVHPEAARQAQAPAEPAMPTNDLDTPSIFRRGSRRLFQ
jgi:hypothetical protein